MRVLVVTGAPAVGKRTVGRLRAAGRARGVLAVRVRDRVAADLRAAASRYRP
jgi:hypothetical protein